MTVFPLPAPTPRPALTGLASPDAPELWLLLLADWRVVRGGLAELLAPAERARAARYRRVDDAERFVLTRGVLRLLLGRRLDVCPRAVELAATPDGRLHLPVPPPPAFPAPPHLSVAHSGECALLGFRDVAPLGVDLERIDPGLDHRAVAADVFPAAERAGWPRWSGRGRRAAFYRAWTRREALFKGAGRTEPAGWVVGNFTTVPGYAAALATGPTPHGVVPTAAPAWRWARPAEWGAGLLRAA